MDASKLKNATSAAGRSLLEMLREELDKTIVTLMEEGSGADPEERGYASGLAFSIATIENPYSLDIHGVKEAAMERWEAAHG